MDKFSNLSITKLYNLQTGQTGPKGNKKGLHKNVVQKGNVGASFIYALQHSGTGQLCF